MSSFIHLHVIADVYDFISSVKYKIRYLDKHYAALLYTTTVFRDHVCQTSLCVSKCHLSCDWFTVFKVLSHVMVCVRTDRNMSDYSLIIFCSLQL